MKGLNQGSRQVLFLAMLVAVPVAAFFLVFRPQNLEIARARQEIGHKQAMLEKLRQATAQTDDLIQANNEMRASIEAIEARLPTNKEMDSILRQVAELAGQSGLKIPNFKKTDKVMPAGLASEQPIEVEMTGDFDGFYQFLLGLEQLARITRITNMELTRAKDVDGATRAKLTLSIYYQDQPK
ncbi:MAG TPA: type 4a pilus biogenesis protein PilO [Phycisphaerales bacterium]|nr:type 4a pilus biogenesis protein PilO [Phycisphaerales bacterium]